MIAVPWGQVFEVFTVACEPVDRREVSCISKSLIKSPEASYKSFGILSDWFREVTALWGNCTDDGDRTFCTIEILHHSGTLIKSGKLGSQVSRETFLCRHFLKSSGKLSKSLGPTGGGVCHDRYIVTHVTIIFSQSNTCVDRCFTGSNRHVGCVGDQSSTVHHQVSGFRVDQLAEVLQNLCHLISTLAAADIDDDICIGPFGNLVLCHGLSGSKTTRNGSRTAFGNREQSVKDTLSCDKRNACRVAQMRRTRNTDRPFLSQCKLFSGSVIQLYCDNWFQNGVITVRSCLDNSSLCDTRRNHGFMEDRSSFLCLGDDRARTYYVSFFNCDM